MLNKWNWMVASASILALSTSTFAHEDDPKLLAEIEPYQGPGYVSPLFLDGSIRYMPPQNAGTMCSSFPCQDVRLLSWMPFADFPGDNFGNDCWGYTSPSGKEYAIFCLERTTAFVDISDPGAPQLVEQIDGAFGGVWRDVKIYQEHAYSVNEDGNGIQVIDLSLIDSGTVSLVTNKGGVGTNDTHNVAINEDSGFLYRCGGGGNGLRIYDLSNPADPVHVASWNTKYVHDAQIITYPQGHAMAGREIAFACSGFNGGWSNPGLTILDVSNKQNIQVITEVFWNDAEYSHQVWISDDLNTLYLNDELDEGNNGFTTRTYVIDISDLENDNASLAGHFTNGNQAIGHNLYVKGDLLYEANYSSGLRVFDTSSSVTNPPEVGYFDTRPQDDVVDYRGLWSVYPYFGSGVVIGSDRDRGLFMWWVGDPGIAIDFPNGMPATIDANGDTIEVTLIEQQGATLDTNSPSLHYDAGSGFQSVPLVNIGGNTWEGTFPATNCDTAIDYYITATTTNNIVWASPEDAPSATWQTTSECSGPTTYCTPKLNSCITVPGMGFSGTSSSSASSGFDITGSNANFNKAGYLLYTDNGQNNVPFQGGTLCVSGPIRRTVVVSSQGGSQGSCNSQFALDMNAFAAGALGGNPQAFLLIPGQQVNVQWWGRDTVANGSYLSDGGEYEVGP